MKIETAKKYNTKIYATKEDANKAAKTELEKSSNLVYMGAHKLADAEGWINGWNVWD